MNGVGACSVTENCNLYFNSYQSLNSLKTRLKSPIHMISNEAPIQLQSKPVLFWTKLYRDITLRYRLLAYQYRIGFITYANDNSFQNVFVHALLVSISIKE